MLNSLTHCGLMTSYGSVAWLHQTIIWTSVDLSLTHWDRVTHICVGNLTIIGSDNGLSPDRRQAIIWTNAGILLIGPLVTKFSEILIEIHIFSLKKMGLKVSSAKWWPFCFGLNVLKGLCGIHPRAITHHRLDLSQHWFRWWQVLSDDAKPLHEYLPTFN